MIRKVNILIKRIYQFQHALADLQQPATNMTVINADRDMTLYKFFRRIPATSGIPLEIVQSQSSVAESQKAQTCIFNSND